MVGELGRWRWLVREGERGMVPGHCEESSKSVPHRGSHTGFSAALRDSSLKVL